MNIGKTIREIRKSRNITLVELAKLAEIDQATLSRIETGKMVGTLESHIKLCEILEISLSDLYRNVDKTDPLCEPINSQTEDIDISKDTGSNIRPMLKNALKKNMFPYLLTINPYGEHIEKKSDKKCEKFIYVLEGSLLLNIGDNNYSLEKGEGIYINNSSDVTIKNDKNIQSRCICISSPPVI